MSHDGANESPLVSSDDFRVADEAAATACTESPVDAPINSCQAPKAFLAVKVTDYQDQPIRDTEVDVDGLGRKTTDGYGIADYGEVLPRTYHIVESKNGYRPSPDKPVGPAKTKANVATSQSVVATVMLECFRENIIFVGSEMDYDSFWLKMMFIAAAWVEASKGGWFRSADRQTAAYVDVGYTRFEKLTLDYLRDKLGYQIAKVRSGGDIVTLFNNRLKANASGVPERYSLQDVAFFSHGMPGIIKMNYKGSPDVDFTASELTSISADCFVPDGRVYSYACRTGVSSWQESFASDQEAGPDASLAQKMASHFNVETRAFLTRSFYGEILREKKDSSTISAALKKARETDDGKIIEIPPEHQGLPHPDLDDGWFAGSKSEGTNEYALWRKAGGIRLPRSGDTPKGLSKGMHVFSPN